MVFYKSSYKNTFSWGISSVGRAPALQAGGHEFDSRILHLAVKTAENWIKYSSLAQSVEHSAVNRSVVGSSPTGGAHKARKFNVYGFYLFLRHVPLGKKRLSAQESRHLIVNRKMNRNCVAGWVPECCPMVNFKFYCRAYLRKDVLLAGKSSLCFSPI